MQSEPVYKEHMFRLIVGFTFVALLLGFLAETAYREFFESITRLVSSEEYSYLLISLFSVFTVIYMSIRYTGFSYGIRLSKIFFIMLTTFISLAFYSLSNFDLEHKVQLLGLSFVFLFITLILLIYEPNSLSEVIPLLTPFLLIPLPTGFLDKLTPIISRYIGRIAGFLANVKVVEASGFTQLEVVSVSGEVTRLSVEAACTGIVTASSIVAVIPILLYMVTFSEDKPLKKVAIATIALFSAFAIGLIGNLVRVLIVVYATMKIGVEQAYTLFHYTPSLIYSTISILVAFLIVQKYCRFRPVFSRVTSRSLPSEATWGYIAGIFLLAILFTSVVSLVLMNVTTRGIDNNVNGLVVKVDDISDYLNNPDKYLSTNNVIFTNKYYDSFLTRVLGAFAVYRVGIGVGGNMFLGYIEIVDTPARLHTWQLCLAVQGYTVRSSWIDLINNTKITYISIEKDGWRGILAYILIPTIVKTSDGVFNLYTRISILASENLYSLATNLNTTLISLIREYRVAELNTGSNWFTNAFALGTTLTLVVFITYVVVVLVWSYRFKARRG